jgi:transposase
MDVHKDSIGIALAEAGARGEVRHYGTIGGGLADVDRALRKIVAGGSTLHVVYEAGPCGYALYRHLTARGIDCTVVSPLAQQCSNGARSCLSPHWEYLED